MLFPDGAPGELEKDVVEAGAPERDGGHGHGELTDQPGHERGTIADLQPEGSVVRGGREVEAVADLGGRGGIVRRGDGDDIPSDAGLQLIGGAERHDPAHVDDGDSIAVFSFVHVVGGHEDRDPLPMP